MISEYSTTYEGGYSYENISRIHSFTTNLVLVIDLASDTDRLGGIVLGHDLVGTLGPLGDAVTSEKRITDTNQDVVNTVQLNELDASFLHIIQNASGPESSVQSSIAIRSTSQLELGRQDDFAAESEARQGALLENDHVVSAQSKVVVLLEELGGGFDSGSRGHDVPSDVALFASPLLGQLLQPDNPLGLELEQGLLGWQTHIIHAFGVVNSESVT